MREKLLGYLGLYAMVNWGLLVCSAIVHAATGESFEFHPAMTGWSNANLLFALLIPTAGFILLRLVIIYTLDNDWCAGPPLILTWAGAWGSTGLYLAYWLTPHKTVVAHVILLAVLTGYWVMYIGSRRGWLDKGVYADLERERVRSLAAPDSAPLPSEHRYPEIAQAMTPKITFKDVFGNEELKARLKKAGEVVIAPRAQVGVTQTRNGILLDGDPGNGKTMLAQALAGELKVPLFTLTHAEVASQWVGKRAERIREFFEFAKLHQPSVLFIDEVDSFLESRSGGRDDGVKEDRDVVNALLTLMVDIRKTRVLLVAATNHLDTLDAAAVREGRFDYKVEVTAPDESARIGLLRQGLQRNLPESVVEADVIERVAKRWNGFSVKRILAVTEELPGYLEQTGRTSPQYADFMGALRAIQGHKGASQEQVIDLDQLVLTSRTRQMLDQIAARMANPERTEALGGTMPRGVLFYGPPGTGKTATCKSLAKRLDWAFLTATGADLARRPKDLEKLYAKAKELRPCLIFIDEADDLMRSREYSSKTDATNKLLTLMDGANDAVKDVVWIAATNHPDQIDAALLRGGRFSEKVRFELPDASRLQHYVEQWVNARRMPMGQGVSIAWIVQMMGEVAVADAEAVLQTALNSAISRSDQHFQVDRSDVEYALDVVMG